VAILFSRIILPGLVSLLLVTSAVTLAAQGFTLTQQPRRPFGVPEASLPCTPEEEAWWTELRAASEDVKSPRKPGEKQRKKFLNVLRDGAEKSYKPPVADAQAVILFRAFPKYPREARIDQIRGAVVLQVEFLADGNVGKIEVVQGLPAGLNEASAEAARKAIFLPAVKNRQFVTWSTRVVMNFNIY
jgi:TonB family protein